MVFVLLVIGAFFLAWSNGANDNFKGVATLYGSGAASFHTALVWATAATAVGSLLSVFMAEKLAVAFSGKGLVPDTFIGPGLLAAVGSAAAVTILLATWLGMPTSTTHALTGALVGAGLAAAGPMAIDWQRLATKFGQPLLLSPIMALGLTAGAYVVLRRVRQRLAIQEDSCLCVSGGEREPAMATAGGLIWRDSGPVRGLEVEIVPAARCELHSPRHGIRLAARRSVDSLHFLSGGAVCFARAVNDTPKIAALLLLGSGVGGTALSAGKLALVALAMAVGGWVQSRKVAETMSKRITDLNPGQGLTANLVTAGLVLGASSVGVPVSTTHVSCGSIFGIGMATSNGRWDTIRQILATWVTTLPLALALGFAIQLVLR